MCLIFGKKNDISLPSKKTNHFLLYRLVHKKMRPKPLNNSKLMYSKSTKLIRCL